MSSAPSIDASIQQNPVMASTGPGRELARFFAPHARARERTAEFFGAEIRNPNTRAAYLTAATRFAHWAETKGLELTRLRPLQVAAYTEQLQQVYAAPSVKQHLAALRMLFDYLVRGGVIEMNPAASVRGPKYVIKKGKTPVLAAEEARYLLSSIRIEDETGRPVIIGLRDRALMGIMAYTFARVSAVTQMRVGVYFQQGKRWWFRLHEKGGKYHEVPAHHKAEEFVDAWLRSAQVVEHPKLPLFPASTETAVLAIGGCIARMCCG